MTQFLPQNLLALFQARDPIPFMPPPSNKRPNEQPYSGLASYMDMFEVLFMQNIWIKFCKNFSNFHPEDCICWGWMFWFIQICLQKVAQRIFYLLQGKLPKFLGWITLLHFASVWFGWLSFCLSIMSNPLSGWFSSEIVFTFLRILKIHHPQQEVKQEMKRKKGR